MAQKIVYGNVNSDGTRYSGTHDWTSGQTGGGTGRYEVIFDEPFDSVPTVVLTQNYKSWNDFGYNGGDARDNAVLIAVDERHFKYKTGKDDGEGSWRNCGFIAIGTGG